VFVPLLWAPSFVTSDGVPGSNRVEDNERSPCLTRSSCRVALPPHAKHENTVDDEAARKQEEQDDSWAAHGRTPRSITSPSSASPTPPAASRGTAYAPIRCRSRSWGHAWRSSKPSPAVWTGFTS